MTEVMELKTEQKITSDYHPSITSLENRDDILETKFTLQGVPICFANGFRRCMISHIPVVQFSVTPEMKARWINTTRFHNEIVEERLLSIPIHTKDLTQLPGKYGLEIDTINDTEHIKIITTEPQFFRIKNKDTGVYLEDSEVAKIFPVHPKTGMPIDFLRLNAMIGNIPSPRLALIADFVVNTAAKDSKCSIVFVGMGNTRDPTTAKEAWEDRERETKKNNPAISQEEMESEKRDFMALDAQRFYKENSFDFTLQTVGIYSWSEIGRLACEQLDQQLGKLANDIETGLAMILPSSNVMDHSWDVKIGGDCYTTGKILEWMMYTHYYLDLEWGGKMKNPLLQFCAFRKSHPHDDEATLRVAFKEETEKSEVQNILIEALAESRKVVREMHALFC